MVLLAVRPFFVSCKSLSNLNFCMALGVSMVEGLDGLWISPVALAYRSALLTTGT